MRGTKPGAQEARLFCPISQVVPSDFPLRDNWRTAYWVFVEWLRDLPMLTSTELRRVMWQTWRDVPLRSPFTKELADKKKKRTCWQPPAVSAFEGFSFPEAQPKSGAPPSGNVCSGDSQWAGRNPVTNWSLFSSLLLLLFLHRCFSPLILPYSQLDLSIYFPENPTCDFSLKLIHSRLVWKAHKIVAISQRWLTA